MNEPALYFCVFAQNLMALELVAAQQQINEMYERLGQASATPLDASELRKALTSSEQCTLEKAGLLEASLGNAACSLSDAILADNASDAMVDADVFCWRRSPLRPSQLANGNCSIRLPMLRRHRLVAPASGSHMWTSSAAGWSHHRRPMVFIGDSVLEGMAHAMQCEMVRGAPSDAAMLSARSDGAAISVIRYGDGSEREDQRTLRSVNASLLAMTSRGGGLVVASFGHHFNNQYARIGFVEGFSVQLRSHLERALVPLLRVLETFASSCRRCLAALVTPSLQHFETTDGTFDQAIFLSTGYGCRAVQNLSAISNSSANCWRAEDMVRLAKLYAPRVLLIPLHTISNDWWAQHPGTAGLKRFVSKYIQRKTTTDCTHLCYSPWLYEPLWWAISLGMESLGLIAAR